MNEATKRFYFITASDVDKADLIKNVDQIPSLLKLKIPKNNFVNIVSSYFPLQRNWTVEYAQTKLIYSEAKFEDSFDSNSIYWSEWAIQINAHFQNVANQDYLSTLRLDLVKGVNHKLLKYVFDIMNICDFNCLSVSFEKISANKLYIIDKKFMNFKQFVQFD